jgi:DNA ligase (NAD+)
MYSVTDQKSFFTISQELLNAQIEENQINSLRNVIRFHEWKYYVENDPLISDFEYDTLFKKLQALEASNASLVTPDSPTQRVSQDITSTASTVSHIIPMLSLENSYNSDDLDDFDKQVKKLCGLDDDTQIRYSVEPKFDGGSIALYYENDMLVRAATRGDGVKGEEITANMKTLRSIPLKASFSKFGFKAVELRGEAVIPRDRFDSINDARAREGLQLLANPRNAATGGLRTKNPIETQERGIEVFIFQFGYAGDENGTDVSSKLTSHKESIDTLANLGFKTPTIERAQCNGIDEVKTFIQSWDEKRDQYRYEIDGMVVKVDSYELQQKCGSTSHHPRWAVAHKFKAKQATSKLLAVEYQVGKIGSITPVAKIQPVQLAGVTVSSVSLHNEEFITSKDLRLGDYVLVERSGDVIPYIVKSLPELRSGSENPIKFPEICPINNTDQPISLLQEEGEAAWRCPNCVCGAQNLQKIIFHVSKEAMDIDGFGRSIVEKFYELGWIKDLSDVYNLDYEAIQSLDGFGAKSSDKLKASIDKAKNNPISRLLHSLTIHHLGKKASKIIAAHVSNVFELQSWTVDQYTVIKDIGPVVAENMVAYFNNPLHISMLQKMEAYGVNFSQTEEDKPAVIDQDAPLANKTILFTGTLSKLDRKQAEELAEKNGAKNISAVSKNLNILVVGESAGSKLQKATDLGTVQILTEDEFLNIIGGI